jgi:acetyltransferase-like isoleucine patch superfamily enzyme
MRRPPFIPTKDYLCNHVINRIPWYSLRMSLYRRLGLRIGPETTILMSTEFHRVEDLTIGRNTVINQHCLLDGRDGLQIGNNVNISSHVLLVAGSHDIHDGQGFGGSAKRIVVEDYAWLCTRCTVLQGVTIGRGAVVAAGAVVTQSVPPYAVVAGIPAKQIGERTSDLAYNLEYSVSWQ